MKITLTKKQLDILATHFDSDVSFGVGGSFGDGSELKSRSEFVIAVELAKKLMNIAGYVSKN